MSADPVVSGDVLASLRLLDSCTVSDALDRLALAPAMAGWPVQTVERPIAGRVVTVQLGEAGTSGAGRHLATAALEASGPGDVLVVGHGGRTDCSGWGGLLSLAATVRQIEGVIVDGACRDVAESRQLRLPVFARAVTPVSARRRVAEVAWDVAIDVAGTRVEPGDLVVADSNGVAFIPSARASEVIDLATELAERESAMGRALRAGEPATTVLGGNYEQMTQLGER